MIEINPIVEKNICYHCGYEWDYTGNNPVTSCPKCGWRVRIYYEKGTSYISINTKYKQFLNSIDEMNLTEKEKNIRKQKLIIRRRNKRKKENELIKFECFAYYSKGKPKCDLCETIDINMLTLDHINNDG